MELQGGGIRDVWLRNNRKNPRWEKYQTRRVEHPFSLESDKRLGDLTASRNENVAVSKGKAKRCDKAGRRGPGEALQKGCRTSARK